MERSGNIRYQKGQNQELDRRFEKYKKLNFQWGTSYSEAFSDEEVDTMIKLWKKETLKPRELTINDVLTLTAGLFFKSKKY